MTEEVFFNITPYEVRAAFVDDGVLREIYIERCLQQGLLGNIYKGKVQRVVSGIQAAFIDIGLERAAFLHVSDLQASSEQTDIRELLRQGQEILVQVYKDSLGSKGVRVTTRFTLPGRYLVFTPGVQHIAISQRISDESLRAHLLQLLTPHTTGGYIFRTAATSANESDLRLEQAHLPTAWADIVAHSQRAKVGELVYAEIPIELRLLRDVVTHSTTKIRVDQLAAVESMRKFTQKMLPHFTHLIEYHVSNQPLFDIYGIEDQLQKALHRKVFLKSGGYLIFDQTEAMTTIDVNTGSYLGHGKQEDTIFKTNKEAVDVIVHQVRLRNLGGIIIIDFIDMLDPEHKVQLLKLLTTALAKDSARTEISELSSLGLIQMTRKRTRESLERILCVPCSVCQQRGTVKSLETMAYEIVRELQQTARHFDWSGFLVVAAPAVANYLGSQAKILADVELQLGRPIKIRVESSYTPEHYDILPLLEKE